MDRHGFSFPSAISRVEYSQVAGGEEPVFEVHRPISDEERSAKRS
jgi:hypothetical protein